MEVNEIKYEDAMKIKAMINTYGVLPVFDTVWQLCNILEEDALLSRMEEIRSLGKRVE